MKLTKSTKRHSAKCESHRRMLVAAPDTRPYFMMGYGDGTGPDSICLELGMGYRAEMSFAEAKNLHYRLSQLLADERFEKLS